MSSADGVSIAASYFRLCGLMHRSAHSGQKCLSCLPDDTKTQPAADDSLRSSEMSSS